MSNNATDATALAARSLPMFTLAARARSGAVSPGSWRALLVVTQSPIGLHSPVVRTVRTPASNRAMHVPDRGVE